MLKMRLTRVGRKHDPSFRVVVVDSKKAPQSGDYLENLGFCDSKNKKLNLKVDRIKYWLSQGVQISDRVHNLLVAEKIVEGKKIDVSRKQAPVG